MFNSQKEKDYTISACYLEVLVYMISLKGVSIKEN